MFEVKAPREIKFVGKPDCVGDLVNGPGGFGEEAAGFAHAQFLKVTGGDRD